MSKFQPGFLIAEEKQIIESKPKVKQNFTAHFVTWKEIFRWDVWMLLWVCEWKDVWTLELVCGDWSGRVETGLGVWRLEWVSGDWIGCLEIGVSVS